MFRNFLVLLKNCSVNFRKAKFIDISILSVLSNKTVTKAFRQLSNVKLIYEKRQGFRKDNIIYVGKINHISNVNIINRKNYDSRNEKNTNKETENLRLNNNKYNKTNYSNIPLRKNLYSNYEQRVYEP